MRVFNAICVESFTSDTYGFQDKPDEFWFVERGKEYTITDPIGDKVAVFHRGWGIPAPANCFAGAKPLRNS